MDEQDIIQHLRTLPREMREHLSAVYGDGALLFAELMKAANGQDVTTEMKRQQGAYMRIAKALKNTLDV